MGRLGLALKVLFQADVAKKLQTALMDNTPKLPEQPAAVSAPAPEPKPSRSEAVTLLAAFQREARLIDFLQEPIDGYSDAQVGAAVREVHRGCRDVVDRMFAPKAVIDQAEGSNVEVADTTSGKFRLTGNVGQAGNATSGQLVHHGWKATACEVPDWTGGDDALQIIAPAEVQV